MNIKELRPLKSQPKDKVLWNPNDWVSKGLPFGESRAEPLRLFLQSFNMQSYESS